MFKYLKTDNSGNHPTQIYSIYCKAGTTPNQAVPEGSLFSMAIGRITSEFTNSIPIYLALNGKKHNEAAEIRYIPVLENMVFEAPISEEDDIESFINGTICDAYLDESGKGVALTINGDATFTVINDSRRYEGFVTVRKL